MQYLAFLSILFVEVDILTDLWRKAIRRVFIVANKGIIVEQITYQH